MRTRRRFDSRRLYLATALADADKINSDITTLGTDSQAFAAVADSLATDLST